MSESLSIAALGKLVDCWIAEGRHVTGPRRINGRLLYARLDSAADLDLTEDERPRNSIKQVLFPRHEELYGYKLGHKRIELTESETPIAEQIVVAARPCDAALGPILDHVFNWDYKDTQYNRRRELTTIVTLACRHHDAHCFCTSVGSAPDDPRGSDVMLHAMDEGILEVCCLTEKGSRLFAGRCDNLPSPSSGRGAGGEGISGDIANQPVLPLTPAISHRENGTAPPRRFDLDKVQEFLAQGFEDSRWPDLARRCLGCGACAYTCPTCHCFDIVDEGAGKEGVRARNWDACQFVPFTLHASGHNPRSRQNQRQRQRIYHKFRIYPEKFGPLLCTGCGNCTRNCPVGLGVAPVLAEIARNTP
jgi:ferredoxin